VSADAEPADPVVASLLAQAEADPDTLGLLLTGSRGAGQADDDSDYDLVWVLSDLAYQSLADQGGPRDHARAVDGRKVELSYVCPAVLAQMAAHPTWRNPDYATAVVLLDRTGDLPALVAAVTALPPDRAGRAAAASYDAYLNGYYRSVKAHRRGDELGARLQAAESVAYIVKTLFALRGRLAPHHDRLLRQLPLVDDLARPPGTLAPRLLEILSTADPSFQHALERDVADLLRAHGHGPVRDAWGGEIDRVWPSTDPAPTGNA
jgi:hypothetical protein